MRRRLAEQKVKPWQPRMWCIPVGSEYVARMEDILELYTSKPSLNRPVVCFDETPVQPIGETRLPWPAQPDQTARIDYEYRRNGTANLFVFLNAHQPSRHIKVTARRTAIDFAECMRDLVYVHYPDAQTVRVVLDKRSTHNAAALYEAFPPEQARAILRRLEFHYVPKHASWLNMARDFAVVIIVLSNTSHLGYAQTISRINPSPSRCLFIKFTSLVKPSALGSSPGFIYLIGISERLVFHILEHGHAAHRLRHDREMEVALRAGHGERLLLALQRKGAILDQPAHRAHS